MVRGFAVIVNYLCEIELWLGWDKSLLLPVEVGSLTEPLVEPEEESSTRDGSQRRDLILNIPYDAEKFWAYIRLAHRSVAVIVVCKNYAAPLQANQVTTTSKYLGAKKLGLFGIIVCRRGFSESARKEQERLWVQEDKMIICLCDNDLLKMLDLREKGEDPTKVIDKKIRLLQKSI